MYRTASIRRTPCFIATSSFAIFLMISAGFACNANLVQAQSSDASSMDLTRVQGPNDEDVAVPTGSLPLGQQDAPALQIITAFLNATNSVSWSGLQASGLLTATAGNSTVQAPSSVTLQSGGLFRLDESFTQGQRSIRLDSSVGAILESDGTMHALAPAAAKSGLIAFSKLMDSTFPYASMSVLDQGTVMVNGASLHRITICEPAVDGIAPTSLDQLSVTDFYFNPSTHMLIKSVASVQLDPADQARYVRAVTYGDYRQAGALVLPYAYSQSLNGQPQWTLQLDSIQLGSSASSSFFDF